MSSIGSALVMRAHDPPITTYNWPDSQQDHEQPGRQSPERASVSRHYQRFRPKRGRGRGARKLTRQPQRIVKIIATPLHRNLGIDPSLLPSTDFEEQIRRGFRDSVRRSVRNSELNGKLTAIQIQASDHSYTPSGGLFFACKTSVRPVAPTP